jgi:LmbE family N-acetylglucosaminyl deacetylase
MAHTQERMTTSVDVSGFVERKRAAVSAHASQMDETFFTRMPPEIFKLAFGTEHFIRSHDATGAPLPEGDLFTGLR